MGSRADVKWRFGMPAKKRNASSRSKLLNRAVKVGRSYLRQAERRLPPDVRKQIERSIKDGQKTVEGAIKQLRTRVDRTARQADLERALKSLESLTRQVRQMARAAASRPAAPAARRTARRPATRKAPARKAAAKAATPSKAPARTPGHGFGSAATGRSELNATGTPALSSGPCAAKCHRSCAWKVAEGNSRAKRTAIGCITATIPSRARRR